MVHQTNQVVRTTPKRPSENTDYVYTCVQISKWRPTQRTAAAVCLKSSIALVNSYENTMDQEHFVMRYESFSCYNHGEYLSHSRNISVDERITKMALSFRTLLHLAVFREAFGQLYESC